MSESQSLIPHYDVRATFPEMALLVGDSITFATLKKTFSTAVLAGPYEPYASYLIVERPVRNTGQNFDSPAQLLIFVCSVCFALFFFCRSSNSPPLLRSPSGLSRPWLPSLRLACRWCTLLPSGISSLPPPPSPPSTTMASRLRLSSSPFWTTPSALCPGTSPRSYPIPRSPSALTLPT